MFKISILGNLLRNSVKVVQTSNRFLSTTFNVLQYHRRILSDEQLDQYHKDGFIVLRDLLTAEEKADVTKIMDEIQTWPPSDDNWFTHYEHINGEKILSRIEKFYEFHPRMKALVDGKLISAVSDCLNEKAVVFKDKINFKFPGSIGYDAHQDEYGYLMYDQGFHVTALIPADDMNINNGCLKLVAGDWGEGRFLEVDENGDIPENLARTMKWIPVECNPGTVVLFTSFVPHKSDVNKADKARRAFYLTFNGISRRDLREEFYGLRREMFPPDHLRHPDKDYSEGIKLFGEQILEMGKENMKKVERGEY